MSRDTLAMVVGSAAGIAVALLISAAFGQTLQEGLYLVPIVIVSSYFIVKHSNSRKK